MAELGITFGDFIVLGLLVLGAVMGLALGLVKAVLFAVSWIGSGFLTFYSYEHINHHFANFFEKPLYADVAAAASIFIVCLILLFWLCSLMWRAVRRSDFSGLDRSLGLLGGLLVGVFLVCVGYLGATWVWSEDDLPATIANARSRPYVEIGAYTISKFLPGATENEAESAVGETGRRLKDAIETERAMRKLLGNTPKSEENPTSKQKGYAAPSRHDMDRLFESKQ